MKNCRGWVLIYPYKQKSAEMSHLEKVFLEIPPQKIFEAPLVCYKGMSLHFFSLRIPK